MPAGAHQAPGRAGAAGRRTRCARCGWRRATGSRSWSTASRSRSSPAGRTCPRGMPGYGRDIIGQTPFGWSLDDAMEGLGPRCSAGRASSGGGGRTTGRWASFQQAVLGHLLGRLGPGGRYWDVGGGKQPPGRRVRAAADRAAPLHRAVHGRDELPADAGHRADGTSAGARAADRAGHGDHDAEHRGGPDLPVAGPVPVARGDLARAPGTASPGTTSRARSRSAAATRRCCCWTSPASLLGPDVPDAVRLHASAASRCGGCGSSRSASGSGCWPPSAGSASLVTHLAAQRRSWVSELSRPAGGGCSWPEDARGRCGTKTVSSSQATGRHEQQRVDPVQTPPWPGSSEPMSLISRSRLIIDSTRSPRVAAATRGGAQEQALPDVAVQQTAAGTIAPAARQATTEPARPSQVFFGLMAGRHRVLPKQDAGEVAADVAADGQRSRNSSARRAPSGRASMSATNTRQPAAGRPA